MAKATPEEEMQAYKELVGEFCESLEADVSKKAKIRYITEEEELKIYKELTGR